LLRKDSKWEWTPEHKVALEEVKARLVADPVRACPDFSGTFTLQTDASDYGIGAILTHGTENDEKAILVGPNVKRSGEKLFNNGQGVLGNCLGDPKAQAVSGRLPLESSNRPMALKWLNSIESPSGRIAR